MNRVIGFLEAVGRDFKKGLDFAEEIAVSPAGKMIVQVLAPGLGTLFNQTVSAVVTAEQNASALGRQNGSGTEKAAEVLALMGPLIKQALSDAGKQSDDAAAQKYLDAVVLILNLIPSGSKIVA